jgi:hypothetical protein
VRRETPLNGREDPTPNRFLNAEASPSSAEWNRTKPVVSQRRAEFFFPP